MTQRIENGPETPAPKKGFSIGRLIPIAIIVGALIAFFAFDLNEYFSLRTLVDQQGNLDAFVDQYGLLAPLAFAALYAVLVAISFPGATFLTIAGGFLFGGIIGPIAVVTGASAGAIAIFLVAKTSLGKGLAEKAGPFVERLRAGFQQNQWSYMFFLRLFPGFPFWVINLVPALLGVPLHVYAIATFIGIIPGATAYAYVGAAIRSVLDQQRSDPEFLAFAECERQAEVAGTSSAACELPIAVGDFVTPQVVIALALLGILALLPVAYNLVRGTRKKPRS